MSNRDTLIARAAELDLEHAGNISNKNLVALIAEAEAKQDTKAVAGDSENGGGAGATPTDAAGEEKPVQPSAADGASQDPAGAAQDTGAATQSAGDVQPAAPAAEVSGLVVVVTGPKKGRRRAGYSFGREPVTIPLEDLSEDAKQALISDPTLTLQIFEDGEPRSEKVSGGFDEADFELPV